MDLILSYYRNPIFGVLVLISLVLIVAVLQLILSSLKENKTNKNIKKYLANFNGVRAEYLNNLNLDEKVNLANCFFKAKMFLDCKQVVLNVLKNHPDNKDLLYLLAECELRLGLLNNAKDILLKILKIRARDEKSLLFLGYIYFMLNEMTNCIEVYKCLNALKNYEEDLSFIKNYSGFDSKNYAVKLDDELVDDKLVTRFYLCKNCSNYSLFYP